MKQGIHRIAPASFLLLLLVGMVQPGWAQKRTLPEEDWYGDIKQALSRHYVGKVVRLRLSMPATRKGIELIDGVLQAAQPQAEPPVAEPGEELTIKSLTVTEHDIELILNKNSPPPKKTFLQKLAIPRPPRINLHFTRELNAQDLTIERINRLLDQAVDAASLAAPKAAPVSPSVSPSVTESAPAAPEPEIVGDSPVLGPDFGELTVESSIPGARIYLDGAYSGTAPRTFRLGAGTHTVLVMSGALSWEQRLSVPGAKSSRIRAELK